MRKTRAPQALGVQIGGTWQLGVSGLPWKLGVLYTVRLGCVGEVFGQRVMGSLLLMDVLR